MTTAIRWRIIVLQLVAILVLAFGAGAAFYASNFTADQIHQQLAPQQIFFPQDAKSGLPADLSQFAGQQVLNGDQAHAYAEKFIGLHLKEIGQGHPYSYWSAQARAETDAAKQAQDQGIADTLFKGETLRSILNQAWTFSVIGQIAFYGALGMLAAALVVLAALAFEVVEVVRGKESVKMVTITSATERPEPMLVN
jgi:predicted outer membrane lipoprotein